MNLFHRFMLFLRTVAFFEKNLEKMEKIEKMIALQKNFRVENFFIYMNLTLFLIILRATLIT